MTSQIERQNILNNTVALPRIQEELSVKALEFEGHYVLTKQMVADYYGVDIRTISRYIERTGRNHTVYCGIYINWIFMNRRIIE